MSSFQFEGRFIMVEGNDLPVTGIMALQAVGSSIDVELSIMLVEVAPGTVRTQSGKPLDRFPVRILFKVTGPARNGCMRPGKRPPR